ncbi:hypothetical protein SAMN05444392_10696 [Seinonella peptonophila]|uniref:Lipoprotein n=1 Tax=Seinonella peptonophila TaxID=112248 RepID=A0A1M4Y8R1_9BACL|nr:hypothetical protein [Seinonella peptonophila]SHF01852.1 hypothetical protein SAMN05444392_10696 [Seinonella peptonophila]
MRYLLLILIGLLLLCGCEDEEERLKAERLKAMQLKTEQSMLKKMQLEKENSLQALPCIQSVNEEVITFYRTASSQMKLQSAFPYQQLEVRLKQCKSPTKFAVENYKRKTLAMLRLEPNHVAIINAKQKFNGHSPNGETGQTLAKELNERFIYWEKHSADGKHLLAQLKQK